jgi:4-amino-4-deoxychorismate lyase
MVKFYNQNYTYDYSFPAVTLAYFLRYPNPYSTHVLSTDVLSRSLDPTNPNLLHTVRIHRKSSRLPPAVLALLPKAVLGNVRGGRSETYILERSTIDVKEGWMRTESRNLDWTGILSVVERQEYHRVLSDNEAMEQGNTGQGSTGVTTTVIFRSRLGDRLRARANRNAGSVVEKEEVDGGVEEKKGFLANWSTMGVQRSIEAIASRRTENQLGKSKEGMMIVLERLRNGGLGGVLEGMRKDRERVLGSAGEQ